MTLFLCKTIRRLTAALYRDRKAAVLPIFGVMVILLVVIGGAAIDVSRAISAREKLSYAIDAASLAVAAELSVSVMNDDQIETLLKNSVEANLSGENILDDALKNLDFVVNSDEGTVTVSSSASLDNYFVDIGGYFTEAMGPEAFSFGSNAQVSYSRYDVELALVVDVTGSMGGDMETLRDASEEVVDILIPEDDDSVESKVRISLVPYSQGVNLSGYASTVKGGNYYDEDEYPDISGSCVTERQDYGSYEVKYTDRNYNYYYADTGEKPPYGTFYGGGTSNCSSSSKLVPLTDNRNMLVRAIRALKATGGTAGQTGVVWGWNSLSPSFQNVWPSDSAPELYTNDDVLKFAIIMTDGDNNRYYDFTETEEQDVRTCGWKTNRWGWERWRCWWETETVTVNEWEEIGEGESYSNTSSTRQREYCAKMKAAGIELFGVYFGSSNTSAGAKNMKSCASTGNYYQATSSAKLIEAFSNIAKKIQQIYLSK